MYTDGVSIYLSVYIRYTHLAKLKRFNELVEVDICALDYLSNTCHTSVTPIFGAV